ncbi:MAG: hypothetical protein ACKVU1_05415 [bacterium]
MRSRRSIGWVIAAALLLHASMVWITWRADTALVTDSMAYIDAARSIAAGHGFVTHVIPLRFGGEGLAPFTTHPPGYPLLIALLLLAGVPAQIAPILLSSVGSAMSVALFVLLARRIFPAAAALLALLYAISYPMAEIGTLALTEPLFLSALFAAILVGTGGDPHPYPGSPRRAFCAGLLSGSLLGLRYAGITALGVLGVFAVQGVFRRDAGERGAARRALIAWGAGALATSLPAIFALIAGRGPAKYAPGGDTVLNNILSCAAHVADDVVIAAPGLSAPVWISAPLGAALLAVAALLAWRRRSPPCGAATRSAATQAAFAIVATFPFVYLAWVAWVRTFVYLNSWPSRHLLPAYPFLLILLAAVFRRPASTNGGARWQRIVPPILVGFVLWYSAGNLAQALDDSRLPRPAIDLGGVPEWIEAHAPAEDAIIATEAHDLAYALPNRRVISLVRRPYRVDELERSDVERLHREQGARWLVLLRARSAEVFSGSYGDYVRSLVESKDLRDFRLAAALPGGLVFEIAR